MNREEMLRQLAAPPEGGWEVLVIGGGASGLGAALDATTRGYRTLLLEGDDFAKGTSSRSTKIIHGGVRYLRQGNIRLVRDSLRERGRLLRNCPALVTERGFVVPHYRWWERAFYGIGLKLYDFLAGDLGLSPSRHLSRSELRAALPTLNPEGLRGGTLYFDGQFDDARLALSLAQAVAEHGGTILNYIRVEELLKDADGRISGVLARDLETNTTHRLLSRAVLNATGVFTDAIRHLDEAGQDTLVAPSQGIHLVLDPHFLPSEHAVMIPKTDDGRLLFVIPWNGKILAGTTDTQRDNAELDPKPLEEEIAYLLDHLGRYLHPAPTRGDILSAFAGLRPLVKPSGGTGSTAQISRDHTIEVSTSGLVTLVGGKWTTYRHMGEEAIDCLAKSAGLPTRPCQTQSLPLPGPRPSDQPDSPRLHPELDLTEAEVLAAVQHDMARTIEDILARRSRALFLNARAALAAAPAVATLLANELGKAPEWQAQQLDAFRQVAADYLPTTHPPTISSSASR